MLERVVQAIQAGDQSTAQKIFAEMHPASRVRGPLALSPLTCLDQAASSVATVIEPREISIPATSKFSRAYRYTTEAARFATIPNASWVSGWDFILSDGAVIRDSGYFPPDLAHVSWPYRYLNETDRIVHYTSSILDCSDEVLFLSAPMAHHIGHWIVDFLPRLLGRARRKLPLITTLDLTPKQLQMLAALGISEIDDLIRIPAGSHVRFPAIHVYRPGEAMPPNPEHVEFVRRGFFRGSRPCAGNRVFLARHSVGTRLVANVDSFETFLESQGFIIADMADLTLAQQQELLGNAEILMGAFGTNLLAVYHAPPGCKIIALEAHADYDTCIAHTAYLLGLEHRALVCQEAPLTPAKLNVPPKDRDVIVDVDALEAIVTG